MANFAITGLPRSGTTLTCHLLNELPNSVALHEPMQTRDVARLPRAELASAVQAFFEQQRQQILKEGTAVSKSHNGKVPSNPIADDEVGGRRRRLIDSRELEISNVDRPDFSLFVKHPSFFTAVLPHLAGRIDCFALVRNPLSVLLSWRDAGMAVTKGRVPAAERFDSDLKGRLDGEPDTLERQFLLLDYFFGRYARYLSGRVIKYEDVVLSGGRALALLNPDASALAAPLSSRNRRALDKDPEAGRIANELLRRESACWAFYNRESVEELFTSAG